jgi:CSLREA domain-containing protein/uncharacterized repeat protein (TIGR01451 family)
LGASPIAYGLGIQYQVTSTGDGDNVGSNLVPDDGTGHCTLRAAIQAANSHAGDDGIGFNIPTSDPGYNAQTGAWTITLPRQLPDISSNIAFNGPGAAQLIVKATADSHNSFRVFNVTATGILTFSGTGTNVILTADDGVGHTGDSDPFDVNVANLILSGTTPPEGLIEFPFNYVLMVSNVGPSSPTAVSVTNVLPMDVSFSGAAPSAGACAYANGVLRCDLGTITTGGTASISVFLTPWRGGPSTNLSLTSGFEFDPFPGNNRATNVLTITGDEDHDGLPDSWEAQHGLSSLDPGDANLDLDHDGHTSLQEYIAGTDPNLTESVLKAIVSVQGQDAQVRFTTVLDRRYFVESAPSPAGPWAAVGNELFGDGDVAQINDLIPLGTSQYFYRVRVVR